MKISVFGSGYVGLVTGACFAELGNLVMCCDVDEQKIQTLKNGQVPFYEPGLKEIIDRNAKEGRLDFTVDAAAAVKLADAIFIAVGTPPKNGGDADLSYVFAVAKTIGENLERDGVVVVTKSTVPIGVTDQIKQTVVDALKQRGKNFKFTIANNPEFLREGKAVSDFLIPDRVVVGVEDEAGKKIMEELYSPMSKNGHPLYFMDIRSSEMTKYAANTFIAARISLVNELAQICELVGADVEKVRMAVGADKRIGQQYIYPGVGYGGSCFPKDIQALARQAKEHGYQPIMTEAIDLVNQNQKEAFADKIIKHLKSTGGKKIALWGLAFKPHTDDMRFAPSLHIIEKLLAERLEVSAYDPVAMPQAKKILQDLISYKEEMYEVLKAADALVIVTEWPQFKEPDFEKVKSLLKTPVIFDGRNIYSPEKMKELGFTYVSIGRPSI